MPLNESTGPDQPARRSDPARCTDEAGAFQAGAFQAGAFQAGAFQAEKRANASEEPAPRKRREVVERPLVRVIRHSEAPSIYFSRLAARHAKPLRWGIVSVGLLAFFALAPPEVEAPIRGAWNAPQKMMGSAFLPSLSPATPTRKRAAKERRRTAKAGNGKAKTAVPEKTPGAGGAPSSSSSRAPKGATGSPLASSPSAGRRHGRRTSGKRPASRSAARKRKVVAKGEQVVGAVEAQGKWLAPLGQTVPLKEKHLWLARCIYAESNRPQEQQLVGWVVRNRVETGFRGETTYEGVILDPGQFSPFNGESRAGGRYRQYYLWLHPAAEQPGWKEALRIAVHVESAPATWRPFPISTRHFFSRRSMPGGEWPWWAEGHDPVQVRGTFSPLPDRFRFFKGLDEDV